MAPPRIEIVGATYHVNGKAVDGSKLFRDDVDRSSFLSLLGDQARRSEWTVLAYSLMSTHYHLVLTLAKPTLSTGFQRLNGLYARTFNRRHGRRGALWQSRFYDVIGESDRQVREAVRYLALNPTRANVCALPEDWPWSSYGAAIGTVGPDPIVDERELLHLFGTSTEEARALLKAMVEELDPRVRSGQTPV